MRLWLVERRPVSNVSVDVRQLLQSFLLILSCCTGIENRQIFLQRDIVHLLGPAVLRLFRDGRVRVADHVTRERGVQADHGGARAPIHVAWNQCGGACGRPGPGQVGLAAGAVVVHPHDHGAVAVAAADHRALPLKGQVPARPRLLYLRLDLWEWDGHILSQTDHTKCRIDIWFEIWHFKYLIYLDS